MAPVTPPHQIIPGYDMNPSPSHFPEPPSRASIHYRSDSSTTAFTHAHSSSANHSQSDSLTSTRQSHRSISSTTSSITKMVTTTTNAAPHHQQPPPPPPPPPPFEVPRLWQTAMSMVSVNAGLTPQQVLQHYHKLWPLQAAAHPGYTELDIWRSRRARERGIRALHVRYAGGDPARIYLMLIYLEERDARTKRPITRLITNTSVRHVLAEPCSNCPLWLPVRSSSSSNENNDNDNNSHVNNKNNNNAGDGSFHPHNNDHTLLPPLLPLDQMASKDPTATTNTTTTALRATTYQIIPCCQDWVKSVNFDDDDDAAPLSEEEKKVPGVMDRLIEEMRRKNALLAAKDEEIARLRKQRAITHPYGDEGRHPDHKGLARVVAAGIAALGADAMIQYWWAAAAAAAFLVVLLFR